jgi:hypothetical protein
MECSKYMALKPYTIEYFQSYTIEYFQSHISFTPRQNFHLFSRS